MTKTLTKQTDAKGRITLGKAFANKTVLVDERDGEVRVRVGRVIPANEAWLYDNKKAMGSVRRGLEQAASGDFAEAPDLEAARELADQLPDD